MMLRRGGRLAGIAFGFLLATLVATPVQAKDYAQKFREAVEAAKKGDAARAIKAFEKDAGKDRDKDKLLCLYEMGAMYQILGDWEKSAATFERARALADEYDLRARASASGAGHQVGAVIMNDKALIYYGSDYERVMCHTLNAVNYLLKNDVEGATIEIRKADEYQKKCEERARLAAEKARGNQEGSTPQGADQEKEPTPEDEARAEQLVQNSPGLSQAFAPMDQFTAGIRNSYQNAFTYYLSGIVYEAQGDKQGYNDAAIDLKKAYDLAPDAPAVRAAYLYNMKRFDSNQYQALSAQLQETAPDLPATEFGTLVVIYEAGLVPEKQEIKVDLPISGALLSFAFPVYSKLETAQYELSVSAGAQSVATERVLDMRPLAVKALVEQRRGIVTRAIARAILKAAATKAAGKQFGSLGQLAMGIFTFASNRADIRSWYSLPAEVRAARLYLPPGDTEIGLSNMTDKVKVNIQPGAVTLLMVRGIEGVAHAKQMTLSRRPGQLDSPVTPPAMVAALAPLQSEPAFASESGVPPKDSAALVQGKYVRQGKSSDFIELHPDGAFSIFQNEKIAAGKYGIQGDVITWIAPWIPNGQSGARLVGETIKDDDGSIWEKQAELQKPVVAGSQGQPTQPVSPSEDSVLGKYIRRDKSGDYIELNPDGTFLLQEDGKGQRGNYKAQADVITLTDPVSNAPAYGLRMSDKTMVRLDGTVWEKQPVPQKIAQPAVPEKSLPNDAAPSHVAGPAPAVSDSVGLQPPSGDVIPSQDHAASVPGKYIRQGKTSDFIQLYPDGTFSILQNEKIAAGKYGIQGDVISWIAPWIPNGQSGARLVGETIKNDDGSIWEKQAELKRTAQPDAPATPPGNVAVPVPLSPKPAAPPPTQG